MPGVLTIAFLEDTQNRLTLLASHPGDDAAARHWVERCAWESLQSVEPDSESRVVTAVVLEKTEVGDFVMRGATP